MRLATWGIVLGVLSVPATAQRVQVQGGSLEGTHVQSAATPVDAFLGIPYATPPLGALRWQPPRAAAAWAGVRKVDRFGARCMQQPLFADMKFRSPGISEDCLTLNIWSPAGAKPGARLPVLFYVHGGGAIAGDGSELRYDGAAMAAQGIVVVTINYRLGAFGFLATNALAAASPTHSAGNYGLLDQAAALAWVRSNVAAFGGDPARITIGGESAGSMSVSVLMTSPLTRTQFAGAIGESGGVMPPTFRPKALVQATRDGDAFTSAAGAPSLAALRAMPAETLLAAQGAQRFRADFIVDGQFLTEAPIDTYAAGRAARVPLLVGANSQEGSWTGILRDQPPTLANYRAGIARLYTDAEALFTLYPAKSDADVPVAATALASDAFLGASTWKWFDLHRRTHQPTYYYYFAHARPAALPPLTNPDVPPIGAVHSAEIEYALGNLDTNPAYAWTADDRRISAVFQGYFTAFIKTGNPNATGLPKWSPAPSGEGVIPRQIVDVKTRSAPFVEQARYEAAVPMLERRVP
ncbi:carboxylesterase/lipase family protein [Sphingomonas sp. R86520]|uniref:carboxylesterase/lipase family protein n=1 Tax=Sphingomonas sp. R86520 TaxID=3093859 RepID=UPI0036D20EBB